MRAPWVRGSERDFTRGRQAAWPPLIFHSAVFFVVVVALNYKTPPTPCLWQSAAVEGSCSFPVPTRRGGGGHAIGPCRAPLLASCSWPGWLFSLALSHDPAVGSGPHSLAHVCNGSSVTGLCPVCCTGRRRARAVRHLWLSWRWVGWWLRGGAWFFHAQKDLILVKYSCF